ncbi:ubiquinol-cytochrome c reductase iron-sulfur subunit [Aliiroseovarius sp.]|uniref:ubiquinol-cytochrome c reductase iron-sulfur subunit n=1 Tax=Aliiroseovarius sp. TaxID=1872442 RepID=UPI002621B4FC|nr:ubiquinol-cytochrome c reductase iron-sulfur subunit [Aliiroseovarius sp.]
MTETSAPPEVSPARRDFIYYATAGTGAVAAGAATWPLINSMNPSADVAALASIEVDLEGIQVGTRVTVKWQGKPVFIDRRTEAQIALARADDTATDLIDPALDAERAERPEWLVVIGICTHLGCVPLGQDSGDPLGEWEGWYCPCHGSHYDTAGRIRKGPAPRNLDLPPYTFVTDTRLRIG